MYNDIILCEPSATIYVYFTTKVDMTEYKVQHNIQEQNANYKLLDREE